MTAPGFLTETRERFLKAILAQLPIERIRELYLFQPMKQGGVESGVAVVAAWPDDATGGAGQETVAPAPDDALETGERETAGAAPVEMPVVDLEDVTGATADAAACELPPGDDAAPPAESSAEEAPPVPQPPTPDPRYTVYTARYRHVLKGPDRGKWEASVVAEADAPLVSIESVVRGVQRRAGDVDAPDHMRADDIRASLRLAPTAPGAPDRP